MGDEANIISTDLTDEVKKKYPPRYNDSFNKLIDSLREISTNVIEQTSIIIEKYPIRKYFSKLIRFLAQRPVLTFALVATIGVCIIPVAIFVLFAVGTLMLTFTGFIVIEGTMLTMGTVLLCSCLLSIWLVLLTVGGVATVAYLGFLRMYGILQSPENLTWNLKRFNSNSQTHGLVVSEKQSRLTDNLYKAD